MRAVQLAEPGHDVGPTQAVGAMVGAGGGAARGKGGEGFGGRELSHLFARRREYPHQVGFRVSACVCLSLAGIDIAVGVNRDPAESREPAYFTGAGAGAGREQGGFPAGLEGSDSGEGRCVENVAG